MQIDEWISLGAQHSAFGTSSSQDAILNVVLTSLLGTRRLEMAAGP